MTKDNYRISKKGLLLFTYLYALFYSGSSVFNYSDQMNAIPDPSLRISFIPEHLPGSNRMAAVRRFPFRVNITLHRERQWFSPRHFRRISVNMLWQSALLCRMSVSTSTANSAPNTIPVNTGFLAKTLPAATFSAKRLLPMPGKSCASS